MFFCWPMLGLRVCLIKVQEIQLVGHFNPIKSFNCLQARLNITNLMKSLIFINSIWITISYFCINVFLLTNGRFKVLFDQGPWNPIGDLLEPTKVTMSSNCWLEPRELVVEHIILDIHQMFFYQSMWGLRFCLIKV
jgi:hypothetical protein